MTQIHFESGQSQPDNLLTSKESQQDEILQQDVSSGQANHLTMTSTLTPEITSAIYPQFILLGDSITQFGAREIQAALQELYIRRLDVLNRGFSGYTSSMGLDVLRQFLPTTYPNPQPQNPSCPIPRINVMAIFYGANDSCLPGYSQHVPLPSYIRSMTALITYPVLKRHGTRVLVITPPPVDEHQLSKPLNRTTWHTACYAQAARNLAADLNVPCVDIWTAFMREAGYGGVLPPPPNYRFTEHDSYHLPGSLPLPANPTMAELLVDGLHFTSKGYQILYNEMVRTIQTELPECLPDNLPSVFKPWRECFEGTVVVEKEA